MCIIMNCSNQPIAQPTAPSIIPSIDSPLPNAPPPSYKEGLVSGVEGSDPTAPPSYDEALAMKRREDEQYQKY